MTNTYNAAKRVGGEVVIEEDGSILYEGEGSTETLCFGSDSAGPERVRELFDNLVVGPTTREALVVIDAAAVTDGGGTSASERHRIFIFNGDPDRIDTHVFNFRAPELTVSVLDGDLYTDQFIATFSGGRFTLGFDTKTGPGLDCANLDPITFTVGAG